MWQAARKGFFNLHQLTIKSRAEALIPPSRATKEGLEAGSYPFLSPLLMPHGVGMHPRAGNGFGDGVWGLVPALLRC